MSTGSWHCELGELGSQERIALTLCELEEELEDEVLAADVWACSRSNRSGAFIWSTHSSVRSSYSRSACAAALGKRYVSSSLASKRRNSWIVVAMSSLMANGSLRRLLISL